MMYAADTAVLWSCTFCAVLIAGICSRCRYRWPVSIAVISGSRQDSDTTSLCTTSAQLSVATAHYCECLISSGAIIDSTWRQPEAGRQRTCAPEHFP